MTREEAIQCLADFGVGPEHIMELIEALEQEPCDYYDTYNETCRRSEIPKEPCEDVISRTELLNAIDTWDKFGCDANGKLVPYQDHYIPYIHYDDVIKCIKGMPPVTPQPKTEQFAKWVASEIFSDLWEYNKDSFVEIACRKLAELGIVKAKGDEWELVEPQESEEV